MTGFRHLKAVAIAACALLVASPAVESAAAQDRGLGIEVREGDKAVNIIGQATAVPTLVEVRDRNDLPVAGALVLFRLGDGDTATLNAGLQQVAVTTDVLGQAAVMVNPIASGEVELSVTAEYLGETVETTIVQTNFATVAEALAAGATVPTVPTSAATGAAAAGGGVALGTGAIVGIVAAAGGAAACAAGACGGGDDRPLPPLPPRLTPGDAQMGVRWSAPSSDGGARIDDYDVRYRPSGGRWEELPDDTSTAMTATIMGLMNGTPYEVQVRAGNSAGDGPWSASARGTPEAPAPPVTAPSAPPAPTLTAGDRQLEVRWSAPSSDGGAAIDDYDVRYRTSGGSWRHLPDAVKSTAATATIMGLMNGTPYEVQVRAGNSAGDGPWSSSARGTPTASAPSAPPAPSLAAGDRQLEVRWSAPSSDGGAAIDDYDVRYRTSGGSWRHLSDAVKSTATTATITGLMNGTPYEVQVGAGNSAGDGPWSSSARGTPTASAPSAPPAPSLAAGDRQLEVRWSAPSSDGGAAIDDYDVRYRTSGGSWRHLSDAVKSTATTATITGLMNGTPYEVQVGAGNSAGDGPWSSSARGTPTASAPSAPPAPSLAAGDRQLEVRWSAPSDNGGAGIDDYDVRYRTSGGTWRHLPDDVKSTATTTATITGLMNGTSYDVQVRAGNRVGDGPWSPSARGTPMASASVPSAPSAPTLTAGDLQLEVSWTEPANNGAEIDDYDVWYRSDGSGTWSVLPDDVKSTARTATITGLRNGTSYDVQVRAGNRVGDGPWSPSARGTPMASASVPSAPTAPTLTAGDLQLEVSWTEPANNGAEIDDYDVWYRSDGSGTWSVLPDDVKSTARTATITGLRNGTSYDVQVRAGNRVGDGPWSPSARGTPMASASVPTAPSAPTAPTLTAGDLQLEVSWTEPANNGAEIDDYDVWYRSDGSGTWSVLPDDVKSTARTATITGLRNGTEYEVQVRAENSVGEGEWSPSARGTPRASASVPSAPTAPTLTAGDLQLEVSWTEPANNGAEIDDYDVWYRSDGSGTWSVLPDDVKSTARTATITDLRNGTEYEVQVRAENSVGAGEWSPSARGTPMASASVPSAPSAPTLTAGDLQLEVSWTEPANNGAEIDDYDVWYRSDGSGTWSVLPDDVKSTATTATIPDLRNGTEYEVQVRAENSVGAGEWSPIARGTPMASVSVPVEPRS